MPENVILIINIRDMQGLCQGVPSNGITVAANVCIALHVLQTHLRLATHEHLDSAHGFVHMCLLVVGALLEDARNLLLRS